ncbi:high-affinity nickel-transport family protein [Yersinia pseudotuberculosis]|uniref:nickel/cobalt transporter n=1 Tax=Yersinia pseudotuberculosis TaxID=633 RepID=UPI000173982E|nr:nickel/cobalt transporter [Yersinia pseudotuberculosis]CQD56984.1 Ni2+-Co2+ transporter (NiCoT) family protein [Yersinia intermedia]AJJ03591.1 high-affinity nickel-transport family protein [Yersinia pseudotuberculosis]AJJ67562.1 high-affinity nickel-transport family protein [Yersinia pseudotuberculosis PB1/+]AYX17404.1 nickel/cobalt transporter [Yersinia pseudotuberculosis]MBO1608966.1 nickel transporter [Yersinia pseudotuberculosis]
MSVVIAPIPRPKQRHWLINLWPLLLFLLILASAGYVSWLYWPELLFKTVAWQKSVHQQMAQLLQQVKAEPHHAGWVLMLFSLIYGVLHAVGPGHGKVVIVTYLATHPARLKSSLKLTFAASILQGSVAILLVTLLLGVWQLSSRYLHQSSFWLEKGSFLLVIGLGMLLCFRAVKRIYRQINALKPQKMTFQQIQPLPANHVHSDNCGCGHRHLPSDKELQAGGDWRTRLTIVLAMGMRPCSGAIMVLLFSKVIGVYWWGILSAMAMALGTSLTISLLALFVHYARRLAVYLSRKRAPAAWGEIAWATLALTGGIILLFAGVLFYLSSQPEMVGAVRPFGR